MPIPFLLIGIGAGSAAVGVGKSVKAGFDQKNASETNKQARAIAEEAAALGNASRERSGKAITDLGRKKIWILNNSMTPFVQAFEQLHNIELEDSAGLRELQNFRIDRQSLEELHAMGSIAASLLGGVASGAALGAITAFGAYGGAMTFGAASTGTAIAALNGAAATNATLAFLGGGSLAAGGLGIAGGTAVLGSLVAGPALAVIGFVVGAKAHVNKDRAYENLAEAQKFREEMDTVQILCKGIRMRAVLFERLLIRLDAVFSPMVYSLEQIIASRGTDYSRYTPEEKAAVAACCALAKAVKSVLDTPILTEEGTLTPESEQISASVQAVIAENAE